MTNQTVKRNQRCARGAMPDGFPFIIGSAVATTGVYCLEWTAAAIILARKKVA